MTHPINKRLKFFSLAAIAAAGFTLAGCVDSTKPLPPSCPTGLNHQPAKSAGCLSVEDGKLLVVQGMNNKVSIPGGSSNPQEPAHCTAHRETWEETGLNVTPTQLIRVFDNGFHLFECQADSDTPLSEPPFYLEIKQAMWLRANDFDQFQWRFPEQKEWLRQQMPNPAPD